MIQQPFRVAQIILNYGNSKHFPGATVTEGFEFLDKNGRSLLSVGCFDRPYTDEISIEDNEQVIGIKALTVRDPASNIHGALYNLQFKLAKLL